MCTYISIYISVYRCIYFSVYIHVYVICIRVCIKCIYLLYISMYDMSVCIYVYDMKYAPSQDTS